MFCLRRQISRFTRETSSNRDGMDHIQLLHRDYLWRFNPQYLQILLQLPVILGKTVDYTNSRHVGVLIQWQIRWCFADGLILYCAALGANAATKILYARCDTCLRTRANEEKLKRGFIMWGTLLKDDLRATLKRPFLHAISSYSVCTNFFSLKR